MKMFIALLGASALLGSVSASSAQANIQVGTLACDVSAGVGLLIEQKQTLNCVYSNSNGQSQNYSGVIKEFGLELGEVKEAQMIWTVLAASNTVAPGALAGDYAGANADASLGLGAGVNVLVGGLENSFTLQPISVDTEKGVSISAGVETLSLTYNQ